MQDAYGSDDKLCNKATTTNGYIICDPQQGFSKTLALGLSDYQGMKWNESNWSDFLYGKKIHLIITRNEQ